MLSFSCVQVGGGPTGVELAAEIHDMIAEDMSSYFPNLKVRSAALALPVLPPCRSRLMGVAGAPAPLQLVLAAHDVVLPPHEHTAVSPACVGRCSTELEECTSTSSQKCSQGLLLARTKPHGTKGAEALQLTCVNSEVAAAAAETALHACLQKLAKVKVIDTHDHILSAYDRQIAVYATEQFNRQGINLVLNCRVSLLQRPACLQVAPRLIQSVVPAFLCG